mmetsp:Transcript_35980/g.80081  ORF Transcript_35980/g.80081 Transcript_35980/m.80081 type:complete len:85 (+) Transcript_35980:1497-1751(+)
MATVSCHARPPCHVMPCRAMQTHGHPLQHHIYYAALHTYLRCRRSKAVAYLPQEASSRCDLAVMMQYQAHTYADGVHAIPMSPW